MLEAEILYQWMTGDARPTYYALSVSGRVYQRPNVNDDWIVLEPRPSPCAREMALLLRGHPDQPVMLPPDASKLWRLVDGLRDATRKFMALGGLTLEGIEERERAVEEFKGGGDAKPG